MLKTKLKLKLILLAIFSCTFLAFINSANAASHYISATASAGTTWAQCVSISMPCTVAVMNANIVAGDIAYLRAGSYSAVIKPINNGTGDADANRIIIAAYTSNGVRERAILSSIGANGHLDIEGTSASNAKKYITIDGLEFGIARTTSESHWIEGQYSEDIVIKNCVFSGWTFGTSIRLNYAKRLKIINNTFGQANNPSTVDSTYDIIGLHNGEYCLIDGNTFLQTQHYSISSSGLEYTVIRNNVFANTWHAGAGFNSTVPNLIENNIFKNQGDSHQFYPDNNQYDAGENPESRAREVQNRMQQFSIQHHGNAKLLIVRKNVFYNNGSTFNSSPLPGSFSGQNYVYNNTMDQNYSAIYSEAPSDITGASAYGEVFKNNIFSRGINYGFFRTCNVNAQAYCNQYIHTYQNNNFYGNASNKLKLITAADSTVLESSNTGLNGIYDSEFINNLNSPPAFTNQTLRDYTLAATSAMIDAGAWLTTVSSPTGSDSAAPYTFTVADAKYFTDGWGIVTGDVIKLQNGQARTVTAINYSTNQITVNSSVSWTNGMGVALDYEGTKPDIGAKEYVSGDTQAPASPSGLVVK
jgi:hypothetical protein